MSDILSLSSNLTSLCKVDNEDENEVVLSFEGRGLKLDTADDGLTF